MILQFLGAAREVTGSMHLIEVNGKKILLDSGLKIIPADDLAANSGNWFDAGL
ncbi:MAG: hypothetical protein HGA25_07765 [Clostridiales bacterium]|nr:hypothetical protein [Clostridiales bacterium]